MIVLRYASKGERFRRTARRFLVGLLLVALALGVLAVVGPIGDNGDAPDDLYYRR